MSFKKLLGASLWKGLLLSMLLLLLLLAAASLMLQRGLLPENAAPVMVCTAYAASVFVGARQAVRGGAGEAGPLPQALTLAVLLYAAVWLIALSGETDFSAHGLLLTAGLFGGALLAGLLGGKRGKRQSDKRQSKERARAVPRRKRR